MPPRAHVSIVPRITYLRIKNYRVLRDVEFRNLTPLTVLIGPNGSGKSTVLDALDFLAEAVTWRLPQAWEVRNRLAGIQTRGSEGDVEFEIKVILADSSFAYLLKLNEEAGIVNVVDEVLIKDGQRVFYKSAPTHYSPNVEYSTDFNLDWTGLHDSTETYLSFASAFPSDYANALDKLLVEFLRGYRYIHLTDAHQKGYSDAGPREKLSPNGDNLPNVLYYLHTKHPETLAKITAKMRQWVPGLADIVTEITSDERLLLRFKDAPFEKPLPAQYMSDGTMRLAALLTLLYEPDAAGLLGIEEPENELHPRLLHQLAEELIKATEQRQLLVATHSPALLNAFEPEQVWIMHRGADGYAQATRTADIPNVKELVEDGSPPGYLWTSNSFTVGDPLAPRPAADAR